MLWCAGAGAGGASVGAGQHAEGAEECDADPQPGRTSRMACVARELLLCAALAVTAIGALQTSPPKVSKHPQPVRFFPEGSPVTDWYQGTLKRALVQISHADVSLVMYYAPWDAECQHVRAEFERAAHIMSSQVYFAAINCWNPGSECRLQHNKIPSWPVIMAYTVNSKGVLYRGPRDAHSMVKFLELVMRPMKRVTSVGDLVSLVAICDAVAVGFTPMSASSRHYNLWYSVALKAREHDPLGEICFAVVTSEDLAYELGVHEFPAVRYMLWNETLEFQGEGEEWSEGHLIQWVLKGLSQPATRIIPMWQKSFSFQPYMNGSPLLILFTPLNPLYEQLPSYDLLREVAMEYYDCASNPWSLEIIRLQHIQRLLYKQRNYIKFCNDFKTTEQKSKTTIQQRDIIAQYTQSMWHNTTYKKTAKNNIFEMLMKNRMSVSLDEDKENMVIVKAQECGTVFPTDKDGYSEFEQCQIHGDVPIFEQFVPYDKFATSMLSGDNDPLSSARLTDMYMEHYCHLMRFAQQREHPIYPAPSANHTSVHGLACKTNKTLNFVVIDSFGNHHFAEWLGIDLGRRVDKTAVVILDSKHESQYELTQRYSEYALREFIANYSAGTLERTLRSLVRDTSHTHYYGSDGLDTSALLEVIELSTRTFSHFVKRPGTVGVVMVCGGACPSHLVRSVLGAVRLLAELNVPVVAARLDALRHDLPWQYTTETYPSVMVFPADRRLESSSYPLAERMSIDGVVALVMRTLGAPAKLHIQLLLCSKALNTGTKRKCLKDTRQHTLALIGRTLKHYRRAQNQTIQNALFSRLQFLRQVSLDLDILHISDVYVDNVKLINVLNSLSRLGKVWDLHIPVLDISKHSS